MIKRNPVIPNINSSANIKNIYVLYECTNGIDDIIRCKYI